MITSHIFGCIYQASKNHQHEPSDTKKGEATSPGLNVHNFPAVEEDFRETDEEPRSAIVGVGTGFQHRRFEVSTGFCVISHSTILLCFRFTRRTSFSLKLSHQFHQERREAPVHDGTDGAGFLYPCIFLHGLASSKNTDGLLHDNLIVFFSVNASSHLISVLSSSRSHLHICTPTCTTTTDGNESLMFPPWLARVGASWHKRCFERLAVGVREVVSGMASCIMAP